MVQLTGLMVNNACVHGSAHRADHVPSLFDPMTHVTAVCLAFSVPRGRGGPRSCLGFKSDKVQGNRRFVDSSGLCLDVVTAI